MAQRSERPRRQPSQPGECSDGGSGSAQSEGTPTPPTPHTKKHAATDTTSSRGAKRRRTEAGALVSPFAAASLAQQQQQQQVVVLVVPDKHFAPPSPRGGAGAATFSRAASWGEAASLAAPSGCMSRQTSAPHSHLVLASQQSSAATVDAAARAALQALGLCNNGTLSPTSRPMPAASQAASSGAAPPAYMQWQWQQQLAAQHMAPTYRMAPQLPSAAQFGGAAPLWASNPQPSFELWAQGHAFASATDPHAAAPPATHTFSFGAAPAVGPPPPLPFFSAAPSPMARAFSALQELPAEPRLASPFAAVATPFDDAPAQPRLAATVERRVSAEPAAPMPPVWSPFAAAAAVPLPAVPVSAALTRQATPSPPLAAAELPAVDPAFQSLAGADWSALFPLDGSLASVGGCGANASLDLQTLFEEWQDGRMAQCL